jgi:hypothetical protein
MPQVLAFFRDAELQRHEGSKTAELPNTGGSAFLTGI